MAPSPCPHLSGPDESGCCPSCGLDLTGPGPALTVAARPGTCRGCGAQRDGGRFCEACGTPDDDPTATGPPVGWSALVSADGGRFDANGARDEGVEFPGTYEWRVPLSASSIRIGRRSRREPSLPELDLTGPPTDPGVSRRHARLLWHDHGWTLLDLGSTNGTDLNGTRIDPHASTLLAPGDTIGVGLWTLVRLEHADGTRGNTSHG